MTVGSIGTWRSSSCRRPWPTTPTGWPGSSVKLERWRVRLLTSAGSPTDAAFSPDSQWIAYRADRDREIMKIAVSGGAPTVVVPASLELQPVYPDWGDRGSIVFSAGFSGIYVVPADGGNPVKISDEGGIRPHFLPGERGVIWSNPYRASTRFLNLETREVTELLPGAIGATYVEGGLCSTRIRPAASGPCRSIRLTRRSPGRPFI